MLGLIVGFYNFISRIVRDRKIFGVCWFYNFIELDLGLVGDFILKIIND